MRGGIEENGYHLRDRGDDILSYSDRKERIHILTLDNVLGKDIYERIHSDPRMKHYHLLGPEQISIKKRLAEIENMAKDTVSSRVLVIDVRSKTLPLLKQTYNKIIGYNRRDLNALCYAVLIGDGPMNLFGAGKTLNVFVSYLAIYRVDFHPAVFFYDPFLHYEPDELQLRGIDDKFQLPEKIPRRLVKYFKSGQDIRVETIRRFFRATNKDEAIRKKRLKTLKGVYQKRIAKQFPHHKDNWEKWLSKKGVRLASEKLHLYPLFFEDWVYELMQKAAKRRI